MPLSSNKLTLTFICKKSNDFSHSYPTYPQFSFPYLFAAGWLLGWMKWKTGSLFPSMVVHFLHNFAVIPWMA